MDEYGFTEHDVIEAKTDLYQIPKGTHGTIIHVYKPGTYEIEFFIQGKSILRTVSFTEIEKSVTK